MRIDEVEAFDRALDTDHALGVVVSGEAVVGESGRGQADGQEAAECGER